MHLREDVALDSTVTLTVSGVDLPTLDAYVRAADLTAFRNCTQSGRRRAFQADACATLLPG